VTVYLDEGGVLVGTTERGTETELDVGVRLVTDVGTVRWRGDDVSFWYRVRPLRATGCRVVI
jgi:hypothetical protein